MIDYENMPVIVTGVQRSGATFIARILDICQVFTGTPLTGMRENKGIKYLIDDYYQKLQLHVEGQYPLPDVNNLLIPHNWHEKVINELKKQNYNKKQVWMYKGHRACQMFPVWAHAFPNARWIIVRRRTGDIIRSCMHTSYMTAFDNQEDWKMWVREHENLFVEMIQTGLNCKVIWPERMARGDYQQIYEMLDWLKLRWNSKVISEIDTMLWKSR